MKKNSRDVLYKEFCHMDTSELLEQMEAMEQSVDFDPDRFAVVLELLDEKAPINETLDTNRDKMKFLNQLTSDIGDVMLRKKLRYRIRSAAMRAAVVVFTFVATASVVIGVAYAYRIPFAVSIIEFGRDVITIRPSGNLEITEETYDGYRSVQDALDACGVVDMVAVKWIPEDYIVENVVVVESESYTNITGVYSNGINYIIQRIAVNREDVSSSLEYSSDKFSESVVSEDYIAGGITHKLASNYEQTQALWESSSGQCVCSLNGDISIDTLKRMINSIY